jgi:adenylate cyclase
VTREQDAARLRALGIPAPAVERALDRDDLQGAVFESVLLPQITERTVSAAEVQARGGLDPDQVRALMEAFGLPPAPPDQPAFTPDEADVLVELGRLQAVFPPELALQLARVYGRQLARIAQASLQVFRHQIAPGLRAGGDDDMAGLEAVQDALQRLLPLAEPLIIGVYRRWTEHELAQAAVNEAELGAGDQPLPGAVEVAFLFCDLKDFTAFADAEGDAAAVAAIDDFMATVTRERGEGSRFMKALGDGAMLVYGQAHEAVEAGARVVAALDDPATPGVHASAHAGVAVVRGGDYFGHAVNIAARLLGAAKRDQLVVTRPVVERCPELAFEPAGTRKIRGVAEPVEVLLLVESAH